MSRTAVMFSDIEHPEVALLGGKGANLVELSRIDGIRVPDGFCVTTDAFRTIVAEAPAVHDLLSRVEAEDGVAIRALGEEFRRELEGIAIPEDVAAEIGGALERLGARGAYAV